MRLKLHHLPEPVAMRLRRFYQARQIRRTVRWSLATLAWYGLLVLLAVHLDRFLFLEPGFRVGLWWGVHGLAALWAAIGLAVLFLRRQTARDVAYAFEAAVPAGVEERYVTLENVMTKDAKGLTETQQQLIAHLAGSAVSHAEQPIRYLPIRDRLMRASLVAVSILALGMGGLFAVPGYQFSLMLHRFYQPKAPLPKPSYLQLVVSPAEPVVGKGEELALQVTVKGRLPSALEWLYRKTGHSPARCVLCTWPDPVKVASFNAGTHVEMSRVQRDLFLYSRSEVASNFNFAVRCGDAQTALHHVEVASQPVIDDVVLTVTPPDYAGQSKQTVTNLTQPMQFLPGSKIAVTFHSDQAVPKREVRFEKVAQPYPHVWDEATRSGSFEFTLKKRTAFEVTVANAHGFFNRERVRVVLNLRDDMPPTVQLDDPPSDVEKVAGELIAFHADIGDDLGIREVSLQYRVNPDPENETPMKEIPVPLESKSVLSTNMTVDFDLEKIGAVSGDLILIQLRARDTAGSDGLSRETRVRVLPFTRDENERLRLRALAFVQAALTNIVVAGVPPVSGDEIVQTPLNARAVDALKMLARKADIAYPDEATWGPLFELLEREHHFTDRPRHKDDVRMIRSVLWKIVGSPSVKGADVRARDLSVLGGEVLPGLYRLRQAKNLTWRLFGMKRETERIEANLSRATNDATSVASTQDRRLQLYLTAIQDLGEELTFLNRDAKWVDAETMKKQVGELNTAAYSVKRGSLSRQRVSCRQVMDGLNAMLHSLQPVYSQLLRDEVAARVRLVSLYQACGTERVISPASDAAKMDYETAERWLAEDGRLMAINPFISLWPRCVNFALRSGMAEVRRMEGAPRKQGETARRKTAEAMLKPTAAVADWVERDRQRMQRMAFEWENKTALTEPISVPEKMLQLSVAEMEEDAANGVDLARAKDRLARVDVAATNLADSVLDSLGFRDMGVASTNGPTANSRLLADYVRTNNLAPTTLLCLRRVQQQISTNAAALDKALQARDGKSAPDGRKIAAIVREDGRLLQYLAEGVELNLQGAPPDRPVGREEWLLVNVRELYNRFHMTAWPSLLVLQKAGEGNGDGGGMSVAIVEMDKLKVLHETASKAIDALAASLEKNEPLEEKEKEKYPILQGYDRTRDIYGALVRMSARDGDPAEIARLMRERYPDLALGYLAEGMRYAASALESARSAESALRRASVDKAEVAARIGACRNALAELKQHVTRSGPGDEQTRVGRTVDDLLRQVDSMKANEARTDAATVSRQIFLLGDVAKGLTALTLELKSAAQAMTQRFSLNGGPEGIATPDARLAVERSQRRLVRQMELAVQMGNHGLLEAGDKGGGPSLGSATAWASFAFAVARSDLNPSEGIRLGGAGSDETANPLVKYLRDELGRARQMPALKHGGGSVKSYLDALYDYLRY